MNTNYKGWQNLFLLCLGLFAGTAFCMKWMEGDFVQNGQKFTIIGLEISYPQEKIEAILSGLDERVRTILRYHLYFDFAFMAGVYPGIAALCIMAREKSSHNWLKNLLLVVALLQAVALGCDIVENYYLLSWIKHPVIGNEFAFFHPVVFAKWGIALTAALLAIPLSIKKRTVNKLKTIFFI